MRRLSYEENLEMFRRRNDPGIPNIGEITNVSELERIISMLRQKQRSEGEEYVIAEWFGRYEGPFLPKGHPGPKFYGNDLKPRREVKEYWKKIGKEGKYWDHHIGSCWNIESLEARIAFLDNQRHGKTPEELITSLLRKRGRYPVSA